MKRSRKPISTTAAKIAWLKEHPAYISHQEKCIRAMKDAGLIATTTYWRDCLCFHEWASAAMLMLQHDTVN